MTKVSMRLPKWMGDCLPLRKAIVCAHCCLYSPIRSHSWHHHQYLDTLLSYAHARHVRWRPYPCTVSALRRLLCCWHIYDSSPTVPYHQTNQRAMSSDANTATNHVGYDYLLRSMKPIPHVNLLSTCFASSTKPVIYNVAAIASTHVSFIGLP